MRKSCLALLFACAAGLGQARELARLDAPETAPVEISLPPLQAPVKREDLAPNQIGVSRRADLEALPRVSEASLQWEASPAGFVARIRTLSPLAQATRAAMRFTAMPAELEIVTAQPMPDGTLQPVAATNSREIARLARGIWPMEYWTATTDGAEQVIEFRAPHLPATTELRFELFDVSHLVQKVGDPVRSKALTFACHVDASCVTDANVRNDGKAVARMVFTESAGKSFLCTGSLLNDRVGSLTPIFATANHCIHTQAAASSLETFWFYYPPTCGAPPAVALRVSGGATLLFADFDTDFALLRLAVPAPAGAMFLGWDPAPLLQGQPIFGLHHPDGSFQRYSSGTFDALVRIRDSGSGAVFANPFSRVLLTQGILEGGSSGSPLLTLPGSFRGTLFGSPDTNACTAVSNVGLYSDFSAVYPMIAGFLAGPNAVDDHGNSAAAATVIQPDTRFVAEINNTSDEDWFRVTFAMAGSWTVSSFDAAPGITVDVRAEVYAANGSTLLAANDDRALGDGNFSLTLNVAAATTLYLRVVGGAGITGHYGVRAAYAPPDDYGDTPATATPLPSDGVFQGRIGSASDQDWFRIAVNGPGTLHVNSLGATDTVGRLYSADGTTLLIENDDEFTPDTNFGITTTVTAATTFYLQVTGWEGSTGPYSLVTSFLFGAAPTPSNYTDLWGNPREPGWGITLNHQGDTIFAALFTYDAAGRDMWLFASDLRLQPNGSFAGALYRSTGAAFNSPWRAIGLTQVGTLSLAFAANGQGTLAYTVNGVAVSKPIERQAFGTAATCLPTSGSRAGATNFQDLWWNPLEPGWGVNLAHQGNTIFAALFTYAADGRDLWLFASGLARQPNGSFTGTLYRTTGPAFNASPWSAPAVSSVGSMTLTFANGTTGNIAYTVNGIAVSKPIERQVFGTQPPICR